MGGFCRFLHGFMNFGSEWWWRVRCSVVRCRDDAIQLRYGAIMGGACVV